MLLLPNLLLKHRLLFGTFSNDQIMLGSLVIRFNHISLFVCLSCLIFVVRLYITAEVKAIKAVHFNFLIVLIIINVISLYNL